MNIFTETAKWWAVEIRFDRPLTKAEVRALEDGMPEYGLIGYDGVVYTQWPNSWPGEWDRKNIETVLRRLPPSKVRAAPYGRDCEGNCDAPGVKCKLGDVTACDPTFKNEDWIRIDPRAP